MHSIVQITTTTTGTIVEWADTPTTVALVFALAGTIYISIHVLRRIRQRAQPKGKAHNLVRLPI